MDYCTCEGDKGHFLVSLRSLSACHSSFEMAPVRVSH